jgi:hypothetical protein
MASDSAELIFDTFGSVLQPRLFPAIKKTRTEAAKKSPAFDFDKIFGSFN